MSEQPISISSDELERENGRFHRFSLISWWDQDRIRNAKVLVIGAGALGNEILKNLALLGFGNVMVADMDLVENSNLSRSVLYREKDNGRPKSEVAAEQAKEIYPDMKVNHFNGNIVYDLGTGIYRWADIVIGGLDNREARLSINRNCWRVDRAWIDGAIEQINGCARVFVPDGPCYECTMSETDWILLNKRRSCNLLTREEMQGGKVPTTPTISSIIAGVQVQEAVKFIHGMETIAGKGFVFNGESCDSYIVEYQLKDDCYTHDIPETIIELPYRSDSVGIAQMQEFACNALGPETVLELGRDLLEKLVCPRCGAEEEMFVSLGKVKKSAAKCPECGENRDVRSFYTIRSDAGISGRTFAEIGVPKYDIIWARNGYRLVGFEFTGDAPEVLGPLMK